MEKQVKELKRAILLNREQDLARGDPRGCNGYRESVGPLHAAAVGDKFNIAQQLLGQGLDPDAVSPQGTAPLHAAARCNAEAVAELLIKFGAQLGPVDAASNTPLMVAAELGHSGIVQQLLKADNATTANLEHRDCLGNSALHLAAAGDHLQVVNLLCTWSANLRALNDSGETPLEVAEKCSSLRVCEYLRPLYHHAGWLKAERSAAQLKIDNHHVLSVLQNKLTDIREVIPTQLARCTPDGKTLLHWAAVRDAAECAEHLLGLGISVDARDRTGSSALHYAALNKAERVCAQLLSRGADVNLQDACGLTPLMLCMIVGAESVAQRLMRTGGVQLGLADQENETALMRAAQRGSESLVRLVVDGSNVLQRNRSGLSAIEISELHGHGKISEMLEAYRPSLDVYPRQSPKNGYCLVINQMHYNSPATTRKGSECDVKRIYDLFPQKLNFRVHERPDLTCDGIISEMKQIGPTLASVDYFVCFILAHGLGDAVLGTDNRLLQIKDIAQQVDAEHCKELVGKPKIFFIQACRNRVDSAAVSYWQETSSQDQLLRPPDVARNIDYFFGFSTWEDCVSYRCIEGSLYIQTLCDVIEDNYRKMDLLKMMTRVCHLVGSTPVPGKESTCYMVPNIKSSLQKDVRFC